MVESLPSFAPCPTCRARIPIVSPKMVRLVKKLQCPEESRFYLCRVRMQSRLRPVRRNPIGLHKSLHELASVLLCEHSDIQGILLS
jgi:hypothetical protein